MRPLEPTLSDLQAQIDRLTDAVAREREAPGSADALDVLADLADRCREILKHWTDIDNRHTSAINDVEARLSEWSAIESRLERESADRMRALEQAIEREWAALKEIHEAPVQELRDQATALGQTSMAAANLSLRAFERTEARLAALETDLHSRLAQLSQDVHAALVEMRREGGGSRALPSSVAPFPLDGVMRIHEEHRDGSVDAGASPQAALNPPPAIDMPRPVIDPTPRALPEVSSQWSDRLASLEHELTAERDVARETAAQTDKLRREGLLTTLAVAALILVAGLIGYRVERSVSARLDDASQRVNAAEHQAQAATDLATREVASVRSNADRQIADARESAHRAEITSAVLSAADLIRLALEGADQTGNANGQALFSRSSGLVVNATHVAAPPSGTTYQVWLLGTGGPGSAGFLVPDAAGRAVFAIDSLPPVPRPVQGLIVTVEPVGGKAAPSGPVLLTTRAPQ